MTYRDALFALAQAVPNLNERDAAFAKSLLDQAHSPYSDAVPLSLRQWEWVRKLADKAKAPCRPRRRVSRRSSSCSPRLAASEEVPAIVFEADDGTCLLRLSPAGAASKAPGTINVTDTAKGFDAKTWFSRIG